jgi:hypothetical protein
VKTTFIGTTIISQGVSVNPPDFQTGSLLSGNHYQTEEHVQNFIVHATQRIEKIFKKILPE